MRVSLSFSSSIHGHFHFINYTYLTLFEQVVVNLTSPEALCLDTAAFVGVTISFLMLLVIAFITIIFLWLRWVPFDDMVSSEEVNLIFAGYERSTGRICCRSCLLGSSDFSHTPHKHGPSVHKDVQQIPDVHLHLHARVTHVSVALVAPTLVSPAIMPPDAPV